MNKREIGIFVVGLIAGPVLYFTLAAITGAFNGARNAVQAAV